MAPHEAESELKAMLTLAGLDFQSPSPSVAWTVFKSFAERPVEGVESGILWQIGCYSFTGEKRCHLDFVRQFSFHVDGEYDHMEQLHLELTCMPTQELLAIERNHWAFDYPSLAEYFADVESFPEFQIALMHSPWSVTVQQERV
jgi:hypothetical protein